MIWSSGSSHTGIRILKTMDALQWNKPEGELRRVRVDIPKCPPDGVVVKVKFSGICGTDLHIMEKIVFSAQKVILGHEISGVVHAVGADVPSIAVGDRVCAYPTGWSCTVCEACLRGKPLYCHVGGIHAAVGFNTDGGWAEFCLLSPKLVHKVPDGLPLDAAVLCEPNLTTLRGWNSLGVVSDGSKILVIGAGIIGLLMVCLLHHRGYRDITVSEISEHRLALVRGLDLGLHAVNPTQLHSSFAGVNTDDHGFEVIVDCSGSTKAIEGAFPLLRRGGTLCILGLCPENSKLSLNPADIVLKELNIIGRVNDPYTFHQSVSLINNMYPRYIDLQKLGVKTFAFSEHDAAFNELRSGKISKAIFEM